MLRPGEFRITDKGIELANLPEAAKVLEIGCGYGDTTERLEKKYGFEVAAIDNSEEMVRRSNERGLKTVAKFGDGEFLDFSSKTFDAIISECVLSLIPKPDEAIHEAYCTLKNGGKYIISDLYFKKETKKIKEEAKRLADTANEREHNHGDCTSHGSHGSDKEASVNGDVSKPKMAAPANLGVLSKMPNSLECGSYTEEGECHEHTMEEFMEPSEYKNVEFRYKDIFFKDGLIEELKEVGFTEIEFLDFTNELDSFVAEKIMNGEDYPFCKDVKNKKGIGYFLIVATKK